MAKAIILSGAGISAESGISTFRDDDGLWENHNMKICIKNLMIVKEVLEKERMIKFIKI
jgi:NAD-dependent deacetylase